MSGKPIALEIATSSLSPDIESKLAQIIAPIFEMKKTMTGEYYLQVNTDYRHILKQPKYNILDFAMKEFGWTDIYDVDLLSVTMKRKYDNTVKVSLKDVIDVDSGYFYNNYIVIKLAPEAICFFSITGKRLKDVLGMEESIAQKASTLEKLIDDKAKSVEDTYSKKYDRLKFDLESVTDTTKRMKDEAAKNLGDVMVQLSELKSGILGDVSTLRDQLNGLSASLTTSLVTSNAELKAGYETKINALNDKLTESVTNINSIQGDQKKILDAVKLNSEQQAGALKLAIDDQSTTIATQKAENDIKFAELKQVNDTKFNLVKTEGDAKLAELKTANDAKYIEQATKQNETRQELKGVIGAVSDENTKRYNELSDKVNEILGAVSAQNTELKKYITILESNVSDLESKVFPTGKDMIRQ